MSILSERLDKLMKQTGISAPEVAELLGCASTSVSNWRSGRTHPTERNRKRLAEAFGVEPSYWSRPIEKAETTRSPDLLESPKLVRTSEAILDDVSAAIKRLNELVGEFERADHGSLSLGVEENAVYASLSRRLS